MAEDPEYAEMIRQRNAEANRRQNERRKAARQELIENVESDPEAAEKLRLYRSLYGRSAEKGEEMYDEACKRRPGSNHEKEQFLQGRRDYYNKEK